MTYGEETNPVCSSACVASDRHRVQVMVIRSKRNKKPPSVHAFAYIKTESNFLTRSRYDMNQHRL
jgi:hypothetical protein